MKFALSPQAFTDGSTGWNVVGVEQETVLLDIACTDRAHAIRLLYELDETAWVEVHTAAVKRLGERV